MFRVHLMMYQPVKAPLGRIPTNIVIFAQFEYERPFVIGRNIYLHIDHFSDAVLFDNDAVGIAASRSLVVPWAFSKGVPTDSTFAIMDYPLVLKRVNKNITFHSIIQLQIT